VRFDDRRIADEQREDPLWIAIEDAHAKRSHARHMRIVRVYLDGAHDASGDHVGEQGRDVGRAIVAGP
jgi:hypothetical protein